NLWAWGYCFDGLGGAAANQTYATAVGKPVGAIGSIKMIGVASSAWTNGVSYFVLYTSGALYALGTNSAHELGVWDDTDRLTWVQPRYNSASGPVMDDIKWLSTNEHDRSYASINVINN